MPIILFTCRRAAVEPIRRCAVTCWMRWRLGSIGSLAPPPHGSDAPAPLDAPLASGQKTGLLFKVIKVSIVTSSVIKLSYERRAVLAAGYGGRRGFAPHRASDSC